MIIIKYGFLVSYTKILANYFFPIVTKNEPSALIYSLEKYSEETKHNYPNNLKELRHEERIKNIINSPVDKNFYFETIEDILSLAPNFIDSFINSISGTNHKIVVLLPIIDPFKRLYSFVFRKKYKDNKKVIESDINSIISLRYYYHLKKYLYTDDLITDSKIAFMNLDNVIMMNYIERLVQLHKENIIELIPLCEETILNNPVNIFNKIGIFNVDNYTLVTTYKNKSERISKDYDVKNTRAYKNIIDKYKTDIDNRYKDIYTLLHKNNICIL